MKRYSLLLICGLALTNGAFAQGLYLRTSIGYAFPAAGQTLDGTATPYSGSTTVTVAGPENYDLKKASFGSGAYLGVGGGYMFNDYIGVDAAFSFGVAPKKYTFDYTNVPQAYSVSVVQQATNPSFLIPALVVRSGGDRIKAYGRVGLVMPLNTEITQDQVYSTTPASHVTDYTFQIKSSFSLGFAAAAGVQYQLSDKVKLTAELSFLSLSTLIKEINFTKLSQDGQSYPTSADSTITQHTTYSAHTNGVTVSSTNQVAYTQPFSNAGFNVGLIFAVGRQGEGSGKRKKGKEHNGYYHH